jgi:anti-repressor protein
MSMRELVPIFKSTIDNDEVNSVNARDLHGALEIGKHFKGWIKDRINQCGLSEDVDYVRFSPDSGKNGGRPSIEYALSLDAAKHLAMIERNDRGKMVRQYFIDFEKKAREMLPQKTFEELTMEVMKGLKARIDEQAARIEKATQVYREMKPKADGYDLFLGPKGSYSIAEAAGSYRMR